MWHEVIDLVKFKENYRRGTIMIDNLTYDFNISFTVDTKLPDWVEDEDVKEFQEIMTNNEQMVNLIEDILIRHFCDKDELFNLKVEINERKGNENDEITSTC